MTKIFYIFILLIAGGLPLAVRANGATNGSTDCHGIFGMMSGMGWGMGAWWPLMMLGYLVWLVVGILAAVWLWKQINKKK